MCQYLLVPSPLCILELSRPIHTELQSKHNYIYVIYKVLVYVQTSQPTTCFGLFQVGHLQVGHKGQRNYNDNIALFYSSSDLYVQPEDDLPGRGRNM